MNQDVKYSVPKNADVFIGLHGPARVGKTTMLNHLAANYDVCSTDPGEALKCMLAATQSPSFYLKRLGNAYLSDDYEGVKSLLKQNKEHLLKSYEGAKSRNELSRDATIGFAEMIRAVYPSFWVKAAKYLFYEKGKVAVGAIINDGELKELQQQYSVIVVNLDCTNPSEEVTQDSRQPLESKVPITLDITYNLYDSINVADGIIKWYNDFINPVATISRRNNA